MIWIFHIRLIASQEVDVLIAVIVWKKKSVQDVIKCWRYRRKMNLLETMMEQNGYFCISYTGLLEALLHWPWLTAHRSCRYTISALHFITSVLTSCYNYITSDTFYIFFILTYIFFISFPIILRWVFKTDGCVTEQLRVDVFIM